MIGSIQIKLEKITIGKIYRNKTLLFPSSSSFVVNKSSTWMLCVCARGFTTERNVARIFLLHVFYHSTPNMALIVYSFFANVNQLTSFGQTIHLDFCFVDHYFSYFKFILLFWLFCFGFVQRLKNIFHWNSSQNTNIMGIYVGRSLLKCSKWNLDSKRDFEQNRIDF